MNDPTEGVRRLMTEAINSNQNDRAALEKQYGKVWNTQELTDEYDVQGFMAPFVVVRRKLDGVMGTLTFQHMPRFYFDFQRDS